MQMARFLSFLSLSLCFVSVVLLHFVEVSKLFSTHGCTDTKVSLLYFFILVARASFCAVIGAHLHILIEKAVYYSSVC